MGGPVILHLHVDGVPAPTPINTGKYGGPTSQRSVRLHWDKGCDATSRGWLVTAI